MAYQLQKSIFGSDRFRTLAVHGANVQRLLWKSTGTENPTYSDIKYVEALIGPDTVNAIPLATLDAYRDHGKPQLRLEQVRESTHWVFSQLRSLGVDLDALAQQPEDESIEEFKGAFDRLMRVLSQRGSASLTTDANWSTLHHPTLTEAAYRP
jgi:transaldolase